MNFAEKCKKSDEKQFSEGPETIIDSSTSYVATVVTAKGDIELELSPEDAPNTVNSFVFLSCKGFYDGLIFHRVEPGFVIQGGDPTGTGTGGPGYTVPAEFEGSNFEIGVLGLARSRQPDSGGSQFFIMLGASPGLNGQYTAFGHVTSGMDVVQQIAVGDVIETIKIEER
jgi:cyclophilin family peptidyl-prolyl cis-trans isomerase